MHKKREYKRRKHKHQSSQVERIAKQLLQQQQQQQNLLPLSQPPLYTDDNRLAPEIGTDDEGILSVSFFADLILSFLASIRYFAFVASFCSLYFVWLFLKQMECHIWMKFSCCSGYSNCLHCGLEILSIHDRGPNQMVQVNWHQYLGKPVQKFIYRPRHNACYSN